MLNAMEKQDKTGNDFDATNVSRALFGKSITTRDTVNNTGLSSGSKKATPLDDFVSFQATARISLNASRMIGSSSYPKSVLNTADIDTCFLMAPISTNKDVSSP